ncbi:MAG TPA: aminotransferase class V-fold PLP-dependent enzyme [Usitatibacter sp.]|nr:aminotransferase class V-fold PLP-dependent enzyme [Usitatibacter sp.]
MTTSFGRSLRTLWDLDRAGVFLNHGSFGACPRAVQEAQARWRAAMESQPDRFFREEVSPEATGGALRTSAARLAAFVGTRPDSLAFVENATSGVQAALAAVPLGRGDRILTTDHTYNAVRLMVEARCAATGASPLVVALPPRPEADGIVATFEAALTREVRVAIVDHVTSPSAIVMPLERIVPLLGRHGARVIVDGAHAVGQLDLDVEAVGADWYTSNAHKWLYAPRGCAFLHARGEAAALTRPLVVSHHVGMGFPRSFDWVGTRDATPWLAVPAAIDFLEGLGPQALRAHDARLVDLATAKLQELGAEPACARELCASMRSFRLPQRRAATREDARALMRTLWEECRVQAMAVELGGRLLFRVSAQAYVSEADVEMGVEALARLGWPGR